VQNLQKVKSDMMVRIAEKLARQIDEHGIKTYPEECCGMILGRIAGDVQIVESIVEIENHHDENRKRRFLITPQQYLRAEQTAKQLHLDLLGFYHSHPDHPAIPSAYDTEHALPLFTYIIASIVQREAKSMTAWQLSEDRFRFVEKVLFVEPA
jgi:proteasome lid subunit RPN8/RPN11